jgi:hypothetical protein
MNTKPRRPQADGAPSSHTTTTSNDARTLITNDGQQVYTDPVYYALRELDFEEVMLINPAHAKALKGHKTDLLTEPRGVTAAQRT